MPKINVIGHLLLKLL